MAERERPWQRLRPMAFEDVQIGAAYAARADLDQRRLLADLGPRHGANDGRGARAVIGAYADIRHQVSSRALFDLPHLDHAERAASSLIEPFTESNSRTRHLTRHA